ncbi:hypothetical protein QP38_2400 [Levilactobacillus brevis]|nr:hypothetical protein QP38_2400 [Levilactobacillus brevis]
MAKILALVWIANIWHTQMFQPNLVIIFLANIAKTWATKTLVNSFCLAKF